ncbi:MAG: hypothetical protein WCT85_03890 [Parachlamydiales bacterium]
MTRSEQSFENRLNFTKEVFKELNGAKYKNGSIIHLKKHYRIPDIYIKAMIDLVILSQIGHNIKGQILYKWEYNGIPSRNLVELIINQERELRKINKKPQKPSTAPIPDNFLTAMEENNLLFLKIFIKKSLSNNYVSLTSDKQMLLDGNSVTQSFFNICLLTGVIIKHSPELYSWNFEKHKTATVKLCRLIMKKEKQLSPPDVIESPEKKKFGEAIFDDLNKIKGSIKKVSEDTDFIWNKTKLHEKDFIEFMNSFNEKISKLNQIFDYLPNEENLKRLSETTTLLYQNNTKYNKKLELIESNFASLLNTIAQNQIDLLSQVNCNGKNAEVTKGLIKVTEIFNSENFPDFIEYFKKQSFKDDEDEKLIEKNKKETVFSPQLSVLMDSTTQLLNKIGRNDESQKNYTESNEIFNFTKEAGQILKEIPEINKQVNIGMASICDLNERFSKIEKHFLSNSNFEIDIMRRIEGHIQLLQHDINKMTSKKNTGIIRKIINAIW